MNGKRWAWAFVGCLIVGMLGGAARGQLVPGQKLFDKTKSLPSVPGYSDRYPQDHSQPGTGLSNSTDSTTSDVACGAQGRLGVCFHCEKYFNGYCEWACSGGLSCNDGPSGFWGGRTCIALGSCVTPGF